MPAFLVALLPLLPPQDTDLRAAYDVETYRLDLAVEPAQKILRGTVAIEALVTADELASFVVDFQGPFTTSSVVEIDRPLEPGGPLAGREIQFHHEGGSLRCDLARGAKKGERLRLAITYAGSPRAQDGFTGFHWKETLDQQPWISTSCQMTGSSSWWPGKDSSAHPADKPARVFLNYTVPNGLYAVGNGRLVSRSLDEKAGTETFHWVHDYPLETYAVTLNVAPYVVVEKKLAIEGQEEPLDFAYYVLPEDAEKAALQFQDVEPMLEAFGAAFGPFPFPRSKFALVQTSFWGMEHSSAVAYGSSFPSWIAAHGGRDRYAARNKHFDYILVHESAHEWWGNAVSAKTWGDFWLHEGFATYAEAVYLERLKGRALADEHLASIRPMVKRTFRLYRGADTEAAAAYDVGVYYKGAWVLNTLRTFVADDERFFAALREFNLAYRYRNASTDDFRAVLERETKRDWKRFFDEWVYGEGHPKLGGSVRVEGSELVVDVTVGATAGTSFHLPLDVAWKEGDLEREHRFDLVPGANTLRTRVGTASGVRLTTLARILCESQVTLP